MISKRGSILAVVTLLSIFFISRVMTISAAEAIPLCVFKALTHLDCPGCGLIRSFISISHGHLVDAIRYNALGPLVYLFLLYYLIRHILLLCKDYPLIVPALVSPGSWMYRFFGILFWGQWLLKLAKAISFKFFLP
jgi:hypothetical protein